MSTRSRPTGRGRGRGNTARAPPSAASDRPATASRPPVSRKRTASAADETANKRTRRSSGHVQAESDEDDDSQIPRRRHTRATAQKAQDEEEGDGDEEDGEEEEDGDEKEDGGDKHEAGDEDEGEDEDEKAEDGDEEDGDEVEIAGKNKKQKGKAQNVKSKSKEVKKKTTKAKSGSKKPRKTSADKAAEDEAADAGPRKKFTQAEEELEEGNDSIAPPPRHLSRAAAVTATISSASATAATIPISSRLRRKDDAPAVGEQESVHKAITPAETQAANTKTATSSADSVAKGKKTAVSDLIETDQAEATRSDMPQDASDIRMHSPVPPEGSSRATGGYIRGKALGSGYNMADKLYDNLDMSILPKRIATKDKVLLYLQQNPANVNIMEKPHATLKLQVCTNLGPLLEGIATKYSPIEHEDQRIFIYEDENWEVKGRFEKAKSSNEAIEWEKSNDEYIIRVLATPSQSTATNPRIDALRRSVSVSRSTSRSTSVSTRTSSGSGELDDENISIGDTDGDDEIPEVIENLTSEQEAVRSYLGFPLRLTKAKPLFPNDIYGKFERYTAVMNAVSLSQTKAWTKPHWNGTPTKPTKMFIVELVASRAGWYRDYEKPFNAAADNYPNMLKWLKKESDAPSSVEIWGVEKKRYLVADLKRWIKQKGTLAVSTVVDEVKSTEAVKKTKKKKKVVSSADSSTR